MEWWGNHRIIPLLLFLLTLISTTLTSILVLDGIPHIQDSVMYVYQAKTYAAGRIANPPLPSQHFWYQHLYPGENETWGIFPPGWPLILAVGLIFRMPWLVNPFLHSLNVVLIYYLGRMVFGRRTGLIASVLAILSPFMRIMGANYMAHTSELFFMLILWYSGILFQRREKRVWAVTAGVALGMLALIRPLTAVFLGVPVWGLYFMPLLLLSRVKCNRKTCTSIIISAGVAAAFVLLLLSYNLALTGEFLMFPSTKYYQIANPDRLGCNKIGFGADRGCIWNYFTGEYGHGISDALRSIKFNVSWLNHILFGWPVTSLIFIPLGFMIAPKRRLAVTLAVLTLLLIFGYSLYWNRGTCYGPRYYYAATPFLLYLTAIGLDWTAKYFSRFGLSRNASTAIILGVLFAWSLFVYVPGMHEEYGNDYWKDFSDIDEKSYTNLMHLKEGVLEGENIIFLPINVFGSGFLINSLDYSDGVLFAKLIDPSITPEETTLKNSSYVLDKYIKSAKNLHQNEYPERNCFIYLPKKSGDFELAQCEKLKASHVI